MVTEELVLESMRALVPVLSFFFYVPIFCATVSCVNVFLNQVPKENSFRFAYYSLMHFRPQISKCGAY